MAAAAARAVGMIVGHAGPVQGARARRLLPSRMLSLTECAGLASAALLKGRAGRAGELGRGEMRREGGGEEGVQPRLHSRAACRGWGVPVAAVGVCYGAGRGAGGGGGGASGDGCGGPLRRTGEAWRGARRGRWFFLGAFIAAALNELARARPVVLPPSLFSYAFIDLRWWAPFSAVASSPPPLHPHHPPTPTHPLHPHLHLPPIPGGALNPAWGGPC